MDPPIPSLKHKSSDTILFRVSDFDLQSPHKDPALLEQRPIKWSRSPAPGTPGGPPLRPNDPNYWRPWNKMNTGEVPEGDTSSLGDSTPEIKSQDCHPSGKTMRPLPRPGYYGQESEWRSWNAIALNQKSSVTAAEIQPSFPVVVDTNEGQRGSVVTMVPPSPHGVGWDPFNLHGKHALASYSPHVDLASAAVDKPTAAFDKPTAAFDKPTAAFIAAANAHGVSIALPCEPLGKSPAAILKMGQGHEQEREHDNRVKTTSVNRCKEENAYNIKIAGRQDEETGKADFSNIAQSGLLWYSIPASTVINHTGHITTNDSSYIVKDSTFPSVATAGAGIPVGECVVGNLIDFSDADEPALAPPPPHPSQLMLDLASITFWPTPAVEPANTALARNAEGMPPVLKDLKEELEKVPSMGSDPQKARKVFRSKGTGWAFEKALMSLAANEGSMPLKGSRHRLMQYTPVVIQATRQPRGPAEDLLAHNFETRCLRAANGRRQGEGSVSLGGNWVKRG